MGTGQNLVPGILKRVAAGYTDETLITVRKMAAAGATADEIETACGRKKGWARQYIYRNNLVWNRMRGDVSRHVIASAGAIAGHANMGHAEWVEEGARLRIGGMTCREIATRLGLAEGTVSGYFARHGIKPAVQVKRAGGSGRKRIHADREGMLALIIRLHVEEALSEGQVAAATKLDRPEIRRLADDVRAQAEAA